MCGRRICGACGICRGAANLLVSLPDSVSFEYGAFTTLGAIALNGFRLSRAQVGEKVAVIGLGLLGLLSVEIARALAAVC